REEKKAQSSPRPRHQGPAQPLHALPKVIGATHHLKPPSSRHLVPSAGLLLQPDQDPVRPHVYRHSSEENRRSDRKSPPEPLVPIVISIVRDPSGLQVGIQEVESEGQNRHGDWETGGDFLMGGPTVEAKREEASSVEVVEKEDTDESEGFGIGAVDSKGEEEEGEPERGTLH
ncbi:hypothetical protein PanWU01x14_324790, partial [Parasponia andersonii]